MGGIATRPDRVYPRYIVLVSENKAVFGRIAITGNPAPDTRATLRAYKITLSKSFSFYVGTGVIV